MENSRMTEAEETSKFWEEEASLRLGRGGGATKYLEMAATRWPLVDEARERSTELESLAEADKWPTLWERAEKTGIGDVAGRRFCTRMLAV